MQLLNWMKYKNFTPSKLAQIFGVSCANIYACLYGNRIPRPKTMKKIFIETKVLVDANDFNGLSREKLEEELLEEELLKQKRAIK